MICWQNHEHDRERFDWVRLRRELRDRPDVDPLDFPADLRRAMRAADEREERMQRRWARAWWGLAATALVWLAYVLWRELTR